MPEGEKDRIDDEAAAKKAEEEGIEGGHADVEKFPQSVMTETDDHQSSTGDPAQALSDEELENSDVIDAPDESS